MRERATTKSGSETSTHATRERSRIEMDVRVVHRRRDVERERRELAAARHFAEEARPKVAELVDRPDGRSERPPQAASTGRWAAW